MDSLRYLPLAILTASLSAQAQTNNTRLEEVVVTSQKREQALQDVPIAVTALTGEDLESSTISDVFDLQQSVPGLIVNQNQTAVTSSFSIRGVGTNGNNFGLESSVGLYVDGVYRARPNSMINNMLDIEAVEVLRGPQGTLFGRNTPSGAVSLRSAEPTQTREGFIDIDAGNFNLVDVSAAVSGPLSDTVASRLSLFGTQRDGYVSDAGNFNLGEDSINDQDRFGGRLQFLITPSDDISFRIIADYSEIDEVCCGALNFVGNAQSRNVPGVSGSDAVVAALGGTVLAENQIAQNLMALNELPVSQSEDSGISAEVNWDLGFATLTSVTAYRQFDSFDRLDVDFTDLAILSQTRDSAQEARSQELRLAFTGERHTGIVGAYFFSQKLENRDVLFPESQFERFILSRPEVSALIDGLNQVNQLTDGFVRAPAPFVNPQMGAANQMRQDHQSIAVFGQFDYQIGEQFIFTLGARYTDEQKDLRGRFTQDARGPQPDVETVSRELMLAQAGSPDFNVLALANAATPFSAQNWGYYFFDTLAPRQNVDETIDDEQLTGTLKLSWLPTDTALFYASYSTGYKAGGTNTDRINAEFSYVFGPETSKSLELGMKSEFPNQNLRVNLSLHQTNYEDFQANSFTGLGFNLQNAGEIDTYGGELEILWRPGDNTDISFAYAYSVAEYESYEQGTCWVATPFHTGIPDPGQSDTNGDGLPDSVFCDRSGDRLPANPENFYTLSGVQTFNFSDNVNLSAKLEHVFYDEMVLEDNNDPLKFQDAYSLLNARLTLSFIQQDIDIALWGRNILDESYHGNVFDAPIQSGRLITYARPPATFGMSLKKSF